MDHLQNHGNGGVIGRFENISEVAATEHSFLSQAYMSKILKDAKLP